MCPVEEKELENKFKRKEMKRDEKRYIIGRYQIDLCLQHHAHISPSSHFCQNLVQWKSLNISGARDTRGQPFKKLRVELNTWYGCKWVQERRHINYWLDWLDCLDCLVYLKPECIWMPLFQKRGWKMLKNVERVSIHFDWRAMFPWYLLPCSPNPLDGVW